MPKCPGCDKEVYFVVEAICSQHPQCAHVNRQGQAEKVVSLGKDWHRGCLKCARCNKTLSAGSHAEHEGKPYCHNPCYSALFGPGGFGRGGAESYKYKK